MHLKYTKQLFVFEKRFKVKNTPKDKKVLLKVSIKPKNVVRVKDLGKWTLSRYRKILQDLRNLDGICAPRSVGGTNLRTHNLSHLNIVLV